MSVSLRSGARSRSTPPSPLLRMVRRSASWDLAFWLHRNGHITYTQLSVLRRNSLDHACTLFDELRFGLGVSADVLMSGLAEIQPLKVLTSGELTAETRVTRHVSPEWCFRHLALPLRDLGAATLIAVADPDRISDIRRSYPAVFGMSIFVLADADMLEVRISDVFQSIMQDGTLTRLNRRFSCRTFGAHSYKRWIWSGPCLVAGFLLTAVAPMGVFNALFALAAALLALKTGLRLWAAWCLWRHSPEDGETPSRPRAPLPVVTLFVPLYKETGIAARLVERLSRIDYPRALLDICLVMEADDAMTHATLDTIRLSTPFRRIIVPEGPIRTKPRAMNYALNMARGRIIGIYDAEDAPEPDQVAKAVVKFQNEKPEVACLQARLDYYNSNWNWMARCFTIEYAVWFRAILPGLRALGWPLPLGGTSVFFRREILEKVGAWDAHNVTEDADLGMRLARLGYKTELLDSTTFEEANCHLWPWIRQRSRWVKGYAATWLVHMRTSVTLWRQLGPRGFAGFQLLFAGTLFGFLLTPLLLSFWLVQIGLPHPVANGFPRPVVFMFPALFVLSEIVSMTLAVMAVRQTRHIRLKRWIPTLGLYFTLACAAAYKALYELIFVPFYWDKTNHGQFTHAESSDPGSIS